MPWHSLGLGPFEVHGGQRMSCALRKDGEGGGMKSASSKLRNAREKLGLTMGDVEAASQRLASKHTNEAYLITPGRLSDFETKGAIPSIVRLYSLAIIYRREFGELLSWFG